MHSQRFSLPLFAAYLPGRIMLECVLLQKEFITEQVELCRVGFNGSMDSAQTLLRNHCFLHT